MFNALSPDTKPWVELGRCLGMAAAALGNNSKDGITVTAYGKNLPFQIILIRDLVGLKLNIYF